MQVTKPILLDETGKEIVEQLRLFNGKDMTGPKGDKGDKGDSFTYADMTDSQKAEIAAPANEAANVARQKAEEAAMSASAIQSLLDDFSYSGDINSEAVSKLAGLESRLSIVEGKYVYLKSVADTTNYPEFVI